LSEKLSTKLESGSKNNGSGGSDGIFERESSFIERLSNYYAVDAATARGV
jgi:hypothetical protein